MQKSRFLLLTAIALAAPMLAPLPVFAKLAPVYTGTFNNNAISGYDAVAYFTQGKPIKGDKKFSANYKGATWFFASAANRDSFLKDPEKYAPQFGGYCAWAVSQGYTASADPEAWKIVNGKLYLNYDKSIQAKWEKEIPKNINSGDKNWPALLAK
jgi:YHS domain-containing protein